MPRSTTKNWATGQVREEVKKKIFALAMNPNLPPTLKKIKTSRQVQLLLEHETDPREWKGPTGGINLTQYSWEQIRSDLLKLEEENV